MSQLSVFASSPEVKSAVLSDSSGGLLDALRCSDGEGVAGVTACLAAALAASGELLGLGKWRKAAAVSAARACLVEARGTALLTAFIEPPAALQNVEKVLGAAAREAT